MSKISFLAISLCYPIVVILAVLLLASVQQRSSSGVAFDNWRLNYRSNEIVMNTFRAEHTTLHEKLKGVLSEAAFTDGCLKLYNVDGTYRADIDQDLLNNAKSAIKAGKNYNDFDGELRCLVRRSFALQYDKSYFDNQVTDYKKNMENLEKRIAETDVRHNDLVKGREEFLALAELENSNRWYAWLAVAMPYNLLVLILTMFMGALGGMVRVMRDYGDTERQNPASSDYIFLPLNGLVVAIGGYVFARTGLLLLSSGKEEASLSPFMVALVGIISGLLARDMIDAIARYGGAILNRQNPAPTGQLPQVGKVEG